MLLENVWLALSKQILLHSCCLFAKYNSLETIQSCPKYILLLNDKLSK